MEGKQLILVEDLVSKNDELHPVQNAMVNYHGSQCGFCTPGFVMSLFAMYKNYSSYNERNYSRFYFRKSYVVVQDIDQSLMLQKV